MSADLIFRRHPRHAECFYAVVSPRRHLSLYQLSNGQWFLHLRRGTPTTGGAEVWLAIAPTPYRFKKRDGTVVDKRHLPDSTKWSPRRAKQWARETFAERAQR